MTFWMMMTMAMATVDPVVVGGWPTLEPRVVAAPPLAGLSTPCEALVDVDADGVPIEVAPLCAPADAERVELHLLSTWRWEPVRVNGRSVPFSLRVQVGTAQEVSLDGAIAELLLAAGDGRGDLPDAVSAVIAAMQAGDRRAGTGEPRFGRDDGVVIQRITADGGDVDVRGYVWWLDQTVDPFWIRVRAHPDGVHWDARCGLLDRESPRMVTHGWWIDRFVGETDWLLADTR